MPDDVVTEFTDRKESLCEMGAAELVMPQHLFRDLVLQQPVDLSHACEIAERCQVSLTATLWRVIEIDLVPLALIVWQRKHKPTEFVPSIVGQMTFLDSPEAMDPPKKMRVERVFVSPTFKGFIPTDKSVPASTERTAANMIDDATQVVYWVRLLRYCWRTLKCWVTK